MLGNNSAPRTLAEMVISSCVLMLGAGISALLFGHVSVLVFKKQAYHESSSAALLALSDYKDMSER